jgi:hypothetical protein
VGLSKVELTEVIEREIDAAVGLATTATFDPISIDQFRLALKAYFNSPRYRLGLCRSLAADE